MLLNYQESITLHKFWDMSCSFNMYAPCIHQVNPYWSNTNLRKCIQCLTLMHFDWKLIIYLPINVVAYDAKIAQIHYSMKTNYIV